MDKKNTGATIKQTISGYSCHAKVRTGLFKLLFMLL